MNTRISTSRTNLLQHLYWLNYWQTCANKGTSSFTSNTLLVLKKDKV